MAGQTVPPPARMDPAVMLTQTQKALSIFYSGQGHSREEFKEAEAWLESFQHYPQAWAVADALISDQNSSPPVLFFAAKTLQTKVYLDWEELEPGMIEPFKQQLVRHLATWSVRRREGGEGGGGGGGRRGGSSGGDLGAFLNRLCVVLAAVAVQVGSEYCTSSRPPRPSRPSGGDWKEVAVTHAKHAESSARANPPSTLLGLARAFTQTRGRGRAVGVTYLCGMGSNICGP
ncbi:Importin-beta [Nannochloropsis gaditana]|uniref:Importin-beta n=1 Tax=Nannochloropsis gaditana TaxID=72520 RepID=W7TSU7_9STRA|nr:Importin-beta [Nannochloropsis gaditana]